MSRGLLRTALGVGLMGGLFVVAGDAGAANAVVAPAAQVRRVELRVDVTGAAHVPGKIEIAATAFLPDPARLPARPVVIFGLPGGGLTRHYFDIHFDGREGYSEAEYHAADGFIFVAIDHLGVGDSTTTALDSMHIEDIADANDAAVREIARRIEQGTLAEGFPAQPHIFKVGIGQSMGGGVTIIMQGRHATYDAIAALGYSAIHVVLPQRSAAETQRVMLAQSSQGGRWTDPKKLSFKTAADTKIDYAYFAFWDDVPQDIIDAKLKHGYPLSINGPNWVSKTLPNCVIAMNSPGYVATEAAHIRVPVLAAMGERDVVPQPLAEPAAYQSATDVSVVVVPHLGHTHNLGGTRQVLWNRIADWARAVAH